MQQGVQEVAVEGVHDRSQHHELERVTGLRVVLLRLAHARGPDNLAKVCGRLTIDNDRLKGGMRVHDEAVGAC